MILKSTFFKAYFYKIIFQLLQNILAFLFTTSRQKFKYILL